MAATLPIDPNLPRVNASTTDLTVGGVVPVAIGVWDGSTFRPVGDAASLGDAQTGFFSLVNSPSIFNGTTWDRERNNIVGTALASAARTDATTSSDIVNYNARGVRIFFNATSITASPSVTLTVQEKDPVSGNYLTLLVGAALATATQAPTLIIYPGVTVAANVSVSQPLPRTWRVSMSVADADSMTYSVSYAYIL